MNLFLEFVKNVINIIKKEDKCKEQKGVFEHCKESINGKNCDICEEDYFFDEEGNCTSYKFCSKKGEYNSCEKCIPGFYLSQYGGSCTPEINCASGIREIGVCNICKQNFYIDYKSGKCISNQEDNEFKYCDNADEVCTQCISGFHLGKDNKCTFSQNCAASDNTICYECIDNYYLDWIISVQILKIVYIQMNMNALNVKMDAIMMH